ncbi:hypothetical protein WJX77_006245 [Trebouxia sp. C0004]
MKCTAKSRLAQVYHSRVFKRDEFTTWFPPVRKGFCKDAVEGWIDLSKLVSVSGGVKTAYEELSYKIGRS